MAPSRTVGLSWEDRRAIGAATAPAPVAERDWRELMAAMAFDEIAEPTQRVVPAIFRNLRDVPELPDRDRLRGAFKYRWSQTTELLHGVRDVLVALAAAGIEHRVLKGAAVQAVCGSIGSRAMGDVDLLVSVADVDRVGDVMAAEGFRRSGFAACSGHSEAEHHGALTYNAGSCHVDVHVAEFKEPVRLLSLMMVAPPRRIRAAGAVLCVPPAELLLLHAAVHGRLASGPTDLVQAVVDVSMLSPHVDPARLVAAARRTGTLPDLLALDAALRAAGAPSIDLAVPASATAQARVESARAAAVDLVTSSSSVVRRIRGRQRGRAALAAVDREFTGARREYATWLRAGQFAVLERAVVRAHGGFLPQPSGTWVSGRTVQPFGGPPVPGLVASTVAEDTLDWRFRVELPGPQAWARLTLASPSLDRLDAFVFRNGVPVTQVVAGDPSTRDIVLRDLGASNEFSVRPLWQVCAECYHGLADLQVRIDLGDDAR